MTTSIYLAAIETHIGKSAIAVSLIDAFHARGKTVAVFKPLVRSREADAQLKALVELCPLQDYAEATGVTYEEIGADIEGSLSRIVYHYGELSKKYDAIVVVGSDFTDIATPVEVGLNGRIAANLNTPVLALVNGRGRTTDQIMRSARLVLNEFRTLSLHMVGVLVGRVAPDKLDEVNEALAALKGCVVAALPESRLLAAPTIRRQFKELGAEMWRGEDAWLERESLGVSVSGMSLPNLLTRIQPEYTQILASDRFDLLPGLLLAQASDTFPSMAALVLVGGYEIPENMRLMLDGLDITLPIGITTKDSFETATILAGLEETMVSTPRKVEEIRQTLPEYFDVEHLIDALERPRRQVRTQHHFEWEISEQAKADRVTIVLPESDDPRILEAASIVLRKGVADIILLGEEQEVRAKAEELDFDIGTARVQSVHEEPLLTQFAEEYARLRAHKGVTLEMARERIQDVSYFGTMMVHMGLAKGMVSGAKNTSAHTIRPSLEFIKTKPGVAVVSGAYFMAMHDRVLVFADCAVNPNPSPSELAAIAISSAETAASFGIEPRIAMLSYSTVDSGTGPDVDAVREATRILMETRPDLPVAGPIQFDAAIEPTVGKLKMPDNPVAGHATVFIFPDLNTGNNCYKAVQRTSGAVAVGPILQGLNKTVTDLSRGATVDDIVSTIAITAVQSQND